MLRTILGGLLAASIIIPLAGCSNPQKDAAEASARADSEKAKILRDYRHCLDKHSGDEKKCDSYRQALDAIK